MKNKVIIIVVIAIVVVGGGLYFILQRESTENKVEDAIEVATGGDVSVDLDDESIKINTNQGSLEIGTDSQLPDGFPSDVYVPDGTITASSTGTVGGVHYTVSLTSTKSVAELKADYESDFTTNGWETTYSTTIESDVALGGMKGDRYLSVSISASDDGTLVVIVVGESAVEE